MFAPSDAESLTRGHLRYLPVLPGNMEFAAVVRHTLLREQPQVVAIELPASLEGAYRKAVRRLPQISVLLYSSVDMVNEDEMTYVPVEPADPFTEAVRTAIEIGADLLFVEPEGSERPHLADHAPDPYSIRTLGYDKYVSLYRQRTVSASKRVENHAAGIAWRLQGTDPSKKVCVVLSLNLLETVLTSTAIPQDEPEGEPRIEIELINPHPDCLAEILNEYPYLQSRYEEYRMLLDDANTIDRPRVQYAVYAHAEAAYNTSTGEHLQHWHRRLLARYTRNLAYIDGDLTAGVFDLAVAARSIVDDNYGWETWESANRYPAQKADSDLETVNLSAEHIYRNAKRLRLQRRLPRYKQSIRPSALKKRKKEEIPGQWAQELDGNNICSYPPEDLQIENYGRFLKQKAKSILSDERERVEPFTSSLLDGIDIRETIRNWHEKKIYVKHRQRLSGDVGSIVVIFDEDREDERYPHLTTWLGEHQNESDMSFYSTPPFENLVGPGIGRAEYGGFLMSLPPRRMYDVWSDADYDFADTKAERLLLAGLDYSVEKIVAYIGPKPPRTVFRTIAARMGHQILYIPLGQLSPTKLKKLRVVHVLDGYARRDIAKDYLW